MVKFKKVRTVAPGERIKAENYNELALAFNQRLAAGAGDPTWRIFWYAHSLVRQVRNPDGDGFVPYAQAWPAADEWWKLYGMTSLTTTCGDNADPWSWPEAGPGEPQGANVANPLMAFEFGRENPTVEPEHNRLTDGTDAGFPGIQVALPPSGTTRSEWTKSLWSSSKAQRGWIERSSPYRASTPAIEAAHSHLGWHYGSFAPYLKSYSCLAPVPVNEGRCPEYEGVEAARWTLIFTPLGPNLPELRYNTCPGQAGSVYYVDRRYDRYVLWRRDADPVVLPYSMYLEGPYAGGGSLTRPDAEILSQSINQFLAEMRGSVIERATLNYQVEAVGFDFQKFFTSQYSLAPAAGGTTDPLTGEVSGSDYPTFSYSTTGIAPIGTVVPLVAGGNVVGGATNTHVLGDSFFVLGAIYVEWKNISSGGSLEFIDSNGNPIELTALGECPAPGETAVTSFEVFSSMTGSPEARAYFLSPVYNTGSVTVRVKSSLTIGASGYVRVELLEQPYYRPDVFDAYAVLRCGLTKGDNTEPDDTGAVISGTGPLDGNGNPTVGPLKTFSDNYFLYGCIYNINGKTSLAQHEYIANWNSVYEGARKLINDNLRMVKREQVVGYELDSTGKNSVLYFKRHVIGSPESTDSTIRFDEEEIRSKSGKIIINANTTTTPREGVAYLVVPKTGTDNIKPIMASHTAGGEVAPNLTGRYPSYCYLDLDEQGETKLYCDDYILYANNKYVLPGYNVAVLPNQAVVNTTQHAFDADNGFVNRLIGLASTPSQLVVGTDIVQSFDPTSTRSTTYTDALGNTRTETIQSARLYWISKTHYPEGNVSEFKNLALHKPTQTNLPQSNSGQGSTVYADNPQQNLTFKYFNGYRYTIKRRFLLPTPTAWVTIGVPPTGSSSSTTNYGFDPSFTFVQNDKTYRGCFVLEDKEAHGMVIGQDVEYQIWATPVVDYNHDNLQLVQQSYFKPRLLSWPAFSTGTGNITITRTHTPHGGAPTTTTFTLAPTATEMVDPCTGICPINPEGTAVWDSAPTYVASRNGAPDAAVTITDTTFIARSNNIVPALEGDLVGAGDASLASRPDGPTPNQAGSCQNKLGPTYKLYGPANSGIQFTVPQDGASPEKTVILGVNETFGWRREDHDAAIPTPPTSQTQYSSIKPTVVGPHNFKAIKYLWKDSVSGQWKDSSTSPSSAQRCQIFQYSVGCNSDELVVLEGVAGCNPAYHLGVTTLTSDFQTKRIHQVQWTPWDPDRYYDGLSSDSITLEDLPLNGTIDLTVRTNMALYQGRKISIHPTTAQTKYIIGTVTYYDPETGYLNLLINEWRGTGTYNSWAVANDPTLPTGPAYYSLNTGYERIYLTFYYAPSLSMFTVRGTGFLTYKNVRYYSGSTVTFYATNPGSPVSDDYKYTVSSDSIKLVSKTARACSNRSFDYFDGIAPDFNVGESDLHPGSTYIVLKGKGISFKRKLNNTVTIQTYTNGQQFTWCAGGATDYDITYATSTGPVSEIRPIEGLVHVAPPTGYTNEWTLFLSFNHYSPSESSIWKTEAYGDQMAFLHNRCHTYSPEIRAPWNADLSKHFAYSQFPVMISEAPPGYTYLKDINRPPWDEPTVEGELPTPSALNQAYYKSCQVYKPDYILDKVRVVYTPTSKTDVDGNVIYDESIVQVTLKGRLQFCPGASVEAHTPYKPSPSQNSITLLRSEPYKTDENALREYLLYLAPRVVDGKVQTLHCRKNVMGDSAATFDLYSLPDDPMGCCHPRFYFTKQIPYVHQKSQNPGKAVDKKQDTRLTVDPFIQMDFYLRAMVGGWLDIQSTGSVNCDATFGISPVGDYLYENLCYQACIPYGTIQDIKPTKLTDYYFLPVAVRSDYHFSFSNPKPPQVLVDYSTFDPGSCTFPDWAPLGATLDTSSSPVPLGGSGYCYPPLVLLLEPCTVAAEFAVTGIHPTTGAITSVAVVYPGDGYVDGNNKSLSVLLTPGAINPGMTSAVLKVDVVGGQVSGPVMIDSGGTGYSPLLGITITGGNNDATARVILTTDQAKSAVKAVEVINQGTGFFDPSSAAATITGSSSPATVAVGINVEFGRVETITVVPTPANDITTLFVENEGPTVMRTKFRVWDASSPTTPVTNFTVTRTNTVIFPFLRDGGTPSTQHLYKVKKYDVHTDTAHGESRVCEFGTNSSDITIGASIVCPNNLGRTDYDDCTRSCSCEWVDPTVLSMTDPQHAGESYLIQDIGTGANTSTLPPPYYLNWSVSPLVRYEVQRKMLYAMGTDRPWETLANDVFPPYIDRSGYQKDFVEDVTDVVEQLPGGSETRIFNVGSAPGNVTVDAIRTILPPEGKPNYQRYFIDRYVTVNVGDGLSYEYFTGTVQTTIETPIYRDSEVYAQFDAEKVLKYTYVIRWNGPVTISWNKLPNHDTLRANLSGSHLSYKVYRSYERRTGSGLTDTGEQLVEEIGHSAVPPGAGTLHLPDFDIDTSSITWAAPDGAATDDVRDFSVKYYVEVTWSDYAQEQDVNEPATGPCVDPNDPILTYKADRLYRVIGRAQRRLRWFSVMPTSLNINTPQGFSPLPNTCAYAEIFNNFARAINALIYARLELPFTKLSRQITRYSTDPTTCMLQGDDPEVAQAGIYDMVCPSDTPIVQYGNWSVVDLGSGAEASRVLDIKKNSGQFACFDQGNKTHAVMQTVSNEIQFAVDPNQDCLNAIPPSLAGNFDATKNVIFIGKVTGDRVLKAVLRTETDHSCCPTFCEAIGAGPSGSECTCTHSDGTVERITNIEPAKFTSTDGTRYISYYDTEVKNQSGQCMKFLAGILSASPLVCGSSAWRTVGSGNNGHTCSIAASSSLLSIAGIRTATYLSFPLY